MILREVKSMFIKNRLTEGVDFKRYEWLDSTSKNVSLSINETDFQSLTMYRIGNPNQIILVTTRPNYSNRGYFQFESWIPGFALYNPGTNYVTVNEQNIEFSLTKDGDNIIYRGTTQKTIPYPLNKVITVTVANNMTRLKSVTTSTGQYIPCKLLQDIPASLSIDNKAYTVDTCGLYYTTTGKFIGNSNLTVEGDVEPETHTGLQQIYQNKLIEGVDYETYDWLKGDAVAYINTNYLLDFDDIKTSIFRLYNTRNQVFEGSRYGTKNNGAGTVLSYSGGGSFGSFFSYSGLMSEWNIKIPINVENTVIMSKNGITLNGNKIISKSATNIPIVGSRFESITPYLIFTSWINNWQIDDRRQKVDYKSFEIEGKLHLVPCQLLRSIPRNLDAQCKERVAGECGMIDLISGKFYGNVANSGTFTVENDNNE